MVSKRYFVAKAANMDALRGCHGNSIWACKGRKALDQPKEFLTEAFEQGPVMLIFSVNNCHGWHGYAHLLSKPGSENSDVLTGDATERTGGDYSSQNVTDIDSVPHIVEQNTTMSDIKSHGELSIDVSATHVVCSEEREWHRFKICWCCIYLKEHGEQCLPFSRTHHLHTMDGTPLNKARNFQEMSETSGKEICDLIEGHYRKLSEAVQKKRDAKVPAPFFKPTGSHDPHVLWRRLVQKVEAMGEVLLACAFGSQRYNLQTPESDIDMFIVYASPTKRVLGFDPPQQTIKNRDTDNTCDYTIHEVHRYCELLLSGDPRCVETLFLHPSTIYSAAPCWQNLALHQRCFLTSQCRDKYLRDAEGAKGLRQMQKWATSGEALVNPMPQKVSKLFYVIIRLLQNARDVALNRPVAVFRQEGSPERDLLMAIRTGSFQYGDAMQEVERLQADIKAAAAALGSSESHQGAAQEVVEDWLLELRYRDLKAYMQKYQSEGDHLK